MCACTSLQSLLRRMYCSQFYVGTVDARTDRQTDRHRLSNYCKLCSLSDVLTVIIPGGGDDCIQRAVDGRIQVNDYIKLTIVAFSLLRQSATLWGRTLMPGCDVIGRLICREHSVRILRWKLPWLHGAVMHVLVTWYGIGLKAYLVLTLCGLALRSTRMTRPRVQRTSPQKNPSLWI